MGQYLAVGLAVRLDVSNGELAQAKIGLDELVGEMEFAEFALVRAVRVYITG